VFAWLTVAASVALWPLGMTPLYGATALVTGALLLAEAHRMERRAARGGAVKPMRLFHWSITYLTLLFAAVAVDALIQ
jgi:protoheme IX farnesyltransferase